MNLRVRFYAVVLLTVGAACDRKMDPRGRLIGASCKTSADCGSAMDCLDNMDFAHKNETRTCEVTCNSSQRDSCPEGFRCEIVISHGPRPVRADAICLRGQ